MIPRRILLLLSLLFLTASVALTQESEQDLEQKVDEEKKRFVEQALKEKSVLQTLIKIDDQYRELSHNLKELNAEKKKLDEILVDNRKQFELAQVQMLKARERAEERLCALYKIYRGSAITYLLAADSIMEMMKRYRNAQFVIEDDLSSLETYRQRIEIMVQKQAVLLERQQQVDQLTIKLTTTKNQTQYARKKQRTILTEIKSNKELYEIKSKEMDASARQLQSGLEKISGKTAANNSAPLDFAEIKGYLDVPMPGKLVDTFGRKVHQKFKTVTFNRGIDIQAQEGTPIRAVYDGKVQIVQFFLGYGRVIIIDHGQRFHTLYANVADPEVKAGQLVRRGETIAFLGHSAVREDPVLHFEIRFQGKAQNPTEWLFLNQDR